MSKYSNTIASSHEDFQVLDNVHVADIFSMPASSISRVGPGSSRVAVGAARRARISPAFEPV